jgi:hypothetical protein
VRPGKMFCSAAALVSWCAITQSPFKLKTIPSCAFLDERTPAARGPVKVLPSRKNDVIVLSTPKPTTTYDNLSFLTKRFRCNRPRCAQQSGKPVGPVVELKGVSPVFC